ncbi:MAG: cytochrome c5 family protein, partial [Gammaproteobacteria bacterium]|nr:cytochrome c5 family protein [Gammaproteobacteria bacterium]
MKKMLIALVVSMGFIGSAMADGKAVYQQACFACHGTGAAGAPKFGDKAAWKARIAQGMAKLNQHAITGFQGKTGYMPAKGGRMDLSDDAVKSAVTYMVTALLTAASL